MQKRKEVSFIQAAIPPKRGAARHIERYDDQALIRFDNEGKVAEIHTTQDAFRRLHEVLHARHSKAKDYKGRRFECKQLIEDCRLHLKHWPWPAGQTPKVFTEDVDDMFANERARRKQVLDEKGHVDPFGDFAQQLRQNATYRGMGNTRKVKSFVSTTAKRIGRGKMRSESYQALANQLFSLIDGGRHEEAAAALEMAFFYEEEQEKKKQRREEAKAKGDGDESEDAKEGKTEPGTEEGDGEYEPDEEGKWAIDDVQDMETIELPLIEPVDHMDRGFRMATSGARIYRPALRRPVLPQRLFIKQAPVAPGGSIIFDASGSMSVDMPKLLDCCMRAPAATIGFYSGDDSPEGQGYLYVFAKEGMRATNLDECNIIGGNGCDGMALDWLMKQESPRIFVTDRGFCGSGDSYVQLARLASLEDLGEVTVYESYDLFQAEYPPLIKAA